MRITNITYHKSILIIDRYTKNLRSWFIFYKNNDIDFNRYHPSGLHKKKIKKQTKREKKFMNLRIYVLKILNDEGDI